MYVEDLWGRWTVLSDEERLQIRQEEVSAARAALLQRQELRRERARVTYRRQVRAVLQPRGRVALATAVTLVLIGGVLVSLLRASPDTPDDTSGGIATSALMQRCEADVRAQLGDQGDLNFPARQQASGQISASPDGKRWDGSVSVTGRDSGLDSPGRTDSDRTDFSCVYTLSTDQISTELILP